MNKKELKERLWDAVDDYEELLRHIGTTLYEHPETGKNEYKAAAELKNILSRQGFTVTNPVEDQFPTAFEAVKGTGAVHIGFLAEYDALPELGHACGHNLIAAMSTVAAVATAQCCSEELTIHLYGCPAEETEGSKVYMAQKGLFDDLTAALIIHPSDRTMIGGTSYATHPLRVTFMGKAAHVADKEYKGLNALDSLVDFYKRLKELEETFDKPHLLGCIITEGGTAPNIVPDRATLKATVRALDTDYLENVMLPQIKSLAAEVAKDHHTPVETEHYEPLYKNMINNAALNVYFIEAFNALHEEFGVYEEEDAEGSTDVGNVSHVTRAAQPEIAIGYHINAHTPEFTTAANSDFAYIQALTGAKAMVAVAAEVLFEKR